MVRIRRGTLADLPAITEIYNQAVRTTTATFDTEPRTLDAQRAWFEEHGSRYPVLVAESDGEVVGWASLSKWSERPAYEGTAEVSVYVDERFRGQGIGRRLLAALLRAGAEAGLHTVIARITTDNIASIRLHESAGFVHVGVLREVGRKFGLLLDVALMQKILEPAEPVASGQKRANSAADGR